MKAEVITDFAALNAIEPAWWDLVGRVPSATPFATPAWLLPWWRTFAPGRLFTVAVTEGDRLLALAPLYVEDGPLGRRLLPLGIGVSDMLDVLVDPAETARAGFALAAVLSEATASIDVWSAEEAPPGASVLALPDPPGWRSRQQVQSACPTLSLGSPEALHAAVPPRKRRKWQMARNRAARRRWSITETTAASLTDDLAHLFRLHGARWESRGEAGVLADATVRRFHDAAAPALLAAKLLRLAVMRLDDTVVGVCHCLADRSTTYAYLGGFDPAFGFESPGTILIGDALETAARSGAQAFSLLRGREAYKYEWGAVDQWNQCRIFEPGR